MKGGAARRKSQSRVNVAPTNFCKSIKKPFLELMLGAECVTARYIDFITEDQLQSCIEMQSRIVPADYDLAEIENCIQKDQLCNRQNSIGMKVWELHLQYTAVLESLGYTDCIQKQTELPVKHIMKHITHEQLKKRISPTFKLCREELK